MVDLMQEAAAWHCEAAGWSLDRTLGEGLLWFVRELVVSVERPVRRGESLTVETWVSDFRRFRTHREYRVLVGEEVAARGQADWLFLARSPEGAIRPRRLPEDMVHDFAFDDETSLGDRPKPAWPDLEGTPSFRMVREVMASELDENDHVNHARYLDWWEDAFAKAGLAAPSTLRLEYLKDANAGDEIAVEIFEGGGRIVRRDEILLRCAWAAVEG